MQRYSFLRLAREALRGNTGWQPVWRDPKVKSGYDVVVIGGGNSGRNTQVTRSNYFYPVSSAFYDHSLKLYEGLARELNFNVMLSQRGQIALAHSEHELEINRRWANAIRMGGVDCEILTPAGIKRLIPIINLDSRHPIAGGFIQHRAGISRHDAVVWGFARGASDLGVDIIQGCEVSGFDLVGGRVRGVRVRSTRPENQAGPLIAADRVVMSVAGHASVLAKQAGLTLPLTTMALQAMVTEPIKPILDKVIMSGAVHAYVSQSDRGEIVIGGGADIYNSYAQRGGLPSMQATIGATLELFPCFSRLRLMRQWAGMVDVSPDTTAIMGLTPIEGLYINCGWGTGGYKAIPAGGDTMAYTVAHNRPHPLIASFGLDRFTRGALVDEGAAAGVAH